MKTLVRYGVVLSVGIAMAGAMKANAADTAGTLPKEEGAKTKEVTIVRDPSATDEVFTPEYLERVNLERQAANSERERERIRHEKVVDFYLKHGR